MTVQWQSFDLANLNLQALILTAHFLIIPRTRQKH